MNSVKIHKLFLMCAVVAFVTISQLYAQVHSSSAYRYLLSQEGLQRHLEFLTSEEIAGRAAGTPQAKQVADYIAGEFEKYGLQPLRSVSFLQPFNLSKGKGKGYNVVGYLPAKKRRKQG